MRTRHFWLVSAEDENQIFAVGVQITGDDDEEAVVYRRDPLTGRTMFGLHNSADQALHRYGKSLPMKLVWQDCGNNHACLDDFLTEDPADDLIQADQD